MAEKEEFRKYYHRRVNVKERITFAAWGFIQLCCKKHKHKLELAQIGSLPFYCCPVTDCLVKVPPMVYEKVSDEILRRFNENHLAVGDSWTVKHCGKLYKCEVMAVSTGKQPLVSISNI